MSKYKEIKGFKVQTLASDTAASVAASGSWASGGTMNTARSDLAGLGIETSAMAVAGYASTGTQSAVETYDGSSWTEITELNAARNSLGGFGATNTASIACGGRSPTVANTESWNGSAWTEVNNMNVARFAMNISGAGTQTSGLSSGGEGPAGQDTVEVWDGTNWTAAGAELNTTRAQGSASGQSSSSAAAVGGYGGSPDAPLATTELWNGSSWTEVADLNTARYSLVCTGNGTSLLVNGGEGSGTGILAITEAFDGTSWTEVANLSDSIKDHGGTGYSSSNATSLSFAGKSPSSSYKNTSEEWTTTPAADFTKQNLGQVYYNSGSNAFKVTGFAFPTGTWASNAAMPTATTERWGTGNSNSDAIFMSPPGVSMEWNGSSWSNGGTQNNNWDSRSAWGGNSSAIVAGGGTAPRTYVETYNGTSFTETADLNTGRGGLPSGSLGSSITDGLVFGGATPGNVEAETETWNGSSWTEVSDLNTARRGSGNSGSGSTSAACFGGNVPSTNASALTETWNGSTWTETTDLNTARNAGSGFGGTTSAGYVGGSSYPSLPPYNVKTEFFNGSTWTETGDLANGRYHNKGGGAGNSAITGGGYLASPSGGQSTENAVWTVDQSNLTITVS